MYPSTITIIFASLASILLSDRSTWVPLHRAIFRAGLIPNVRTRLISPDRITSHPGDSASEVLSVPSTSPPGLPEQFSR